MTLEAIASIRSTGKYSCCHVFKDSLHFLLLLEENLEGFYYESVEGCALSHCSCQFSKSVLWHFCEDSAMQNVFCTLGEGVPETLNIDIVKKFLPLKRTSLFSVENHLDLGILHYFRKIKGNNFSFRQRTPACWSFYWCLTLSVGM